MFVFCLFFPVCLSSVSLSSLSALSFIPLSVKVYQPEHWTPLPMSPSRTLSSGHSRGLTAIACHSAHDRDLSKWSQERFLIKAHNSVWNPQWNILESALSLSSPLENLQSFRIWSDPEASGIYTVLQREYWRERERVLQRILQREYHIKRCSWRCRHRFRSL